MLFFVVFCVLPVLFFPLSLFLAYLLFTHQFFIPISVLLLVPFGYGLSPILLCFCIAFISVRIFFSSPPIYFSSSPSFAFFSPLVSFYSCSSSSSPPIIIFLLIASLPLSLSHFLFLFPFYVIFISLLSNLFTHPLFTFQSALLPFLSSYHSSSSSFQPQAKNRLITKTFTSSLVADVILPSMWPNVFA